jgi:hypothetical protein
MSELDKDFDQVVSQINAKLKEAADAISEANRLSETVGLPALIYTQWLRDDAYMNNRRSDDPKDRDEIENELEELQAKLEKIDVHELESALGQGGWSTSSSYC